MLEKARQNTADCGEHQVDDARKMISVINSVPESKRGFIVAIASAYIDGVTAGEAMSAGGAG